MSRVHLSNREQVAAYGYGIGERGEIFSRAQRQTGLFVTQVRRRRYVRKADGSLLWSGPDLGAFLESFWFAERYPDEPPEGYHIVQFDSGHYGFERPDGSEYYGEWADSRAMAVYAAHNDARLGR